MRHGVAGYTLSRTSAQRTGLRRSLVTELIDHGRIQTTETKCKAIQNQAEKLVTVAKKSMSGDKSVQVSARRLVAGRLDGGVTVVRKLFEEIAPRYAERKGGYTRIYKLGPRKGDNAPMALITWVE
ncbi:MAG TPA: 50S ribosomal protein L17 [Thermoflexales bacterium]|nr:50S ribosomal protein L17 [Thermoflexales bacterium]HQV28652.1 50S ribosomal protein L17 [Thermoflexales bacterium]HQX11166.1 50S ribosomal protein L17 [Thermoflexales bacterium]HQY24243.1 50S ribosomal protein L17 [Thermoflexales bacterium]HQZ53947.1 50S ribosomal protein L17 [Thermoflexales bacterium]